MLRVRKTFAFLALLSAFLALPAAADQIHVALLAAGTTDVLVVEGATAATRSMLFCGFSARETGAAAAGVATVYNGVDANGQKVFTFSLAISESRSEGPWSASDCIPAPEGIFVDRAGAGTTEMEIFYRTRAN